MNNVNDQQAIHPATANLIGDIVAARAPVVSAEGSMFAILPPGYKRENITDEVRKLKPVQVRKSGTAILKSIDSFITYARHQDMQHLGYVYANIEHRTLTAVFNDYRGIDADAPAQTDPAAPTELSYVGEAAAGWRDHRAKFTAELTPEAQRWIDHNTKQFGQTEFAEFLEDNFADLAGNEAQSLLTVATTIRAATAINFSSAKRLQDGQTQFTYNEMIDASAGADGTMSIPKEFTLGLRLFKGDTSGYALRARLKYRMHSGSVKFWYELDRHERALEDAFTGYVEKAKDAGYTVLLGQAGHERA